MNRYFPIFHGLHERAPWGVAVEREPSVTDGQPKSSPRCELLMLCRSEAEAKQHAEHVSLGQALKDFHAQKFVEPKGGQ